MNPDWRNRYEVAVNAAQRAGRMALRYYDTNLDVEWKHDRTPVTLADRETEALLRNALLTAARNSDQAAARGDSGFGELYTLRFPLRTSHGAATVLSVWIVRHGEDFPRLATCYIV